MKTVLTILLLSFFLNLSGQTEKYSRISVQTDEQGIVQIARLGVNLDHASFAEGHLTFEASSGEIELLVQHNFHFEVLIPDMTEWYVPVSYTHLTLPTKRIV